MRQLPIVFISCAVLLASLISSQAHAQRRITPAPWAAERRATPPEDIEVSLATFGPGSDVPSWFGHSALVVRDKTRGTQRLYNYGMFDFGPTMLANFVSGRLLFWVGPASYKRTLNFYKRQDRDVRVQILNLEPAGAQKIAEYLEWNIKPENREYLYDHYKDNCSTRLRDLIDEATGGQFKEASRAIPARLTIRDHTRRHANWPIIDYGMMILMNSDIDVPVTTWEEMFLPLELEDRLDAATYKNSKGEVIPLVASKSVFHKAVDRQPVRQQPPLLWPWMVLLGLLFAAPSVWLGRLFATNPGSRAWRVLFGLYQIALGLGFGGVGVSLILMWSSTDHVITYHNENLLWVSPLILFNAWLGLGIVRNKHMAPVRMVTLWKVCTGIACVGALLKVTPWFAQQNHLTVALMVPFLSGMLVTVLWSLKPLFAPGRALR